MESTTTQFNYCERHDLTEEAMPEGSCNPKFETLCHILIKFVLRFHVSGTPPMW